MSCTTCDTLRAVLAVAERHGDRSKAVDCRVLLRRHPEHDDVPVEGKAEREAERKGEP
ncbi:hypothetical protein NCG97_17755 [Streptomyces lydicamycinicus]|uniref:Uncharacterized protein n=1 Tax=Streptomyces lydicamycinicus TaxID=1546107 RepID=A0A0P4R3E8_9ACTN|nr:hypothetical protein [Streptomyces lydicamycinicus]USA05482.1 hypothetical protein NCG97_17755 [Streptomyces lydicamycinicus]GAO07024.1 hypothetical protein TPA0598_02_02620 [Streptomyces lydicamycinicus]